MGLISMLDHVWARIPPNNTIPVWEQKEIQQPEVERLVSSVFGAQSGLSGTKRTKRKDISSGAVKASVYVTVDNTIEIGDIIQSVVGVREDVVIPAQQVTLSSDPYEIGVPGAQTINQYGLDELSEIGKNTAHTIVDGKAIFRRRLSELEDAMGELNSLLPEHTPGQDIPEIERAVLKVANVANWDTKVPINPVYNGAKALVNVGVRSMRHGVPMSGSVVKDLLGAITGTWQNYVVTGLVPTIVPVRLKSDVVYEGDIDTKVIATELAQVDYSVK